MTISPNHLIVLNYSQKYEIISLSDPNLPIIGPYGEERGLRMAQGNAEKIRNGSNPSVDQTDNSSVTKLESRIALSDALIRRRTIKTFDTAI